ncbi:MAG: hypothetical protein KA138_08225 [Saprospiraceae bacterium]|nr:hypothetical protein [Saprospiraceae bacterium]
MNQPSLPRELLFLRNSIETNSIILCAADPPHFPTAISCRLRHPGAWCEDF